jgi:hypothetical protein
VVYGWREGAKWGFFAPLYLLAGRQHRTYFDLSDSFCRKLAVLFVARVGPGPVR